MDARQIAKRYLLTWALFDAGIVGADWTSQIIKHTATASEQQSSNVSRLLRMTRNIRILRLLRGIKTGQLLKMIEDRIQSESLSVVWTTCKLFISICFINHMSACIWYHIGISGSDHLNWIDKYLKGHEFGEDTSYRYITSFHWALTQFTPASIEVQPTNSDERLFSVFMLLFALVTVSTFVSGITSAVMQLRQLSAAKSKKFWLLRRYLSEHGVPTQLAVRINNYCEHAWRNRGRKVQEKDVDLLMTISATLRAELKAAMFAPKLTFHAFFMLLQHVAPLTMRSLCNTAIVPLDLGRGEQMFCTGEAAGSMYFICRGEVSYHFADALAGELVTSLAWLCEACLWTHFTHKGGLVSKSDCVILALEADHFGKVVTLHHDARSEAVAYAKGFLQGLNREPPWKVNDLYQSSLIEGLWFRLLNDFQVTRRATRSMHGSNRQSEMPTTFEKVRDHAEHAWAHMGPLKRCCLRVLPRRADSEGEEDSDEE